MTRVVTKAILARPDGDVLLLRRSATDPRRPLQWDFPGGNLGPGELYDDAVVRETREETGLEIAPGSLQLANGGSDCFVHPETGEATNYVWLFYVGRVESDTVALSREHDQMAWVKPSDILAMVTHPQHAELVKYILDMKLMPI